MTSSPNGPVLYASVHACSLVAHLALEHVTAPFEVCFLDLAKGDHRSESFLRLNPRGKVPLLTVGDRAITENIGILSWLDWRHPGVCLFPNSESGERAAMLADLAWFASGIHPLLTRMLVPDRFASADCCVSVETRARADLDSQFELLERRLEGKTWWSGALGAADFYLFWLVARAGEAPFDVSPFVQVWAHANRVAELPAARRALARERAVAPCFEQFR